MYRFYFDPKGCFSPPLFESVVADDCEREHF